MASRRRIVSTRGGEVPALAGEETSSSKAGIQFLTRSVVVLLGGTALSQVASLIAFPVLGRLYTPVDFGLLGVFTSTVSMIGAFATLAYKFAIPLPRSERVAGNLTGLSILLTSLIAALMTVAVLFLGHDYARWVGTPALAPYLWFAPAGVLGFGVYQSLSFWATRKRDFSVLSYTRAAQSVAQNGIQVGAGLGGFGPVGLISGFVVSQFVGIGTLVRGSRPPFGRMRIKRWPATAFAYRKFPLYTVWGSVINVVGVQIPVILMATWFSAGTAGVFTLTMRALGFPVTLLGQAAGRVYYPTIAQLEGDAATAQKVVQRFTVFLLTSSIAVFAILLTQGPALFSLVFGSGWAEAGVYSRYLAIWFVFSLVSSPLSTTPLVKGRQRAAMWLTVYETGLRIAAIGTGALVGSPRLSVLLYAVVGVVISSVYVGWTVRLTGMAAGVFLRTLGPVLIAAGLLLSCLLGIHLIASSYLALFTSVVAVGAFASWGWKSGRLSLSLG